LARTKTSFGSGENNPKWKGGLHQTNKGYIRIRTKKNRDKFAHRVVVEEMLQNPLCAEYVFPERGKIPEGMTVEHVDHRRAHNCRGNLMLLDKRIHDAISTDYRWLLARQEYEDEVPF
jgi:hypothetical protein